MWVNQTMKQNLWRGILILLCLATGAALRAQGEKADLADPDRGEAREPEIVAAPKAPEGDDAGVSFNVLQLRRQYPHIYKGCRKDLLFNTRLAKRLQSQAESLKSEAKHSESKKRKYDEAKELASLFAELAEQNAVVLKAFEGQGQRGLITEAALKKIPKLENRIKNLSGKEVKRDWLTFDEVQEYANRGLLYRTENEEVQPHSKSHWYEPKKKDRKEQD